MKSLKIILILLVLLVLIMASTGLYILNETEQSIITQFGKPIGNAVTTAGIHFKLPVIHKVIKFEKRLLDWDGAPQEIPTADNKFIHIDTYARWRITDALSFYTSTTNETVAQSRLDDLLDGVVRDEIASHTLPEIIRSTNREMTYLEDEDYENRDMDLEKTVGRKIIGSRTNIANNVVESVSKKLADLHLGIEVVDFKFKRIDYNSEVQEKVFSRMISDQKRIAEKYRAQGEGEKQNIMGQIEQKKKEILSQAYLESQTIRGEADGKAIKIYADAYNKDSDSREFYDFMRSMEAYKKSIDSSSTMIFSTDNEFLKYLGTSK